MKTCCYRTQQQVFSDFLFFDIRYGVQEDEHRHGVAHKVYGDFETAESDVCGQGKKDIDAVSLEKADKKYRVYQALYECHEIVIVKDGLAYKLENKPKRFGVLEIIV